MKLPLFSHRCKGSADCEACQSTVSMERVCSLSSPESTLSTSSSASAQSSASPRKHPNRYDRCNSTAIFPFFFLFAFYCILSETATKGFSNSFVVCSLAVCQKTNRRAAVTRWTARPPRTPLATAPVPLWSDASSPAAIRTASPVSHASPPRPSPASQLFVRWWYLR